jgi:site-specific recombinase XerD
MVTTPGTHLDIPPGPGVTTYRQDQEAFLRHLDDVAARHVRDQEPINTRRGYRADWNRWLQFAEELEVDPSTVRESLLTTFVVWLETKHAAPNTINRNLTGVTRTLRDMHGIVAVPKGITGQARRQLKNYRLRAEKENLKLGRGQAPAMTVDHLRLLVAAQPQDTLAGLRNRALLTLQFGMAGRQSEPGSLLVTDITDCGDFLDVNLRYGKTGGRMVSIAAGTHPDSDAVTAWNRWRTAAGITAGPAFRPIDRHGHLGPRALTGWGVNEVIIGATARAGLDVHYTGHSPRAGLITTAWAAGKDDKTITDQSGHVPGSTQVHIYKRPVDRRHKNATTGLL